MEDNETGYYAVLGIEKTNDRGAIWKGFRNVGIKHLPDENSDHYRDHSIKFAKICEAYEVLSTPDLKQIYDNYGEKILKNGLPSISVHPGYAFTGDWYGKTQALLILQNSNFKRITLLSLDTFISALKKPVIGEKEEKKLEESKKRKIIPDLIIEVNWTLRELYSGCFKIISYKREKLLHYSGRKTENITCEKEIEIKPGYSGGQEIRYPGEGHDAVGKYSGDLIVRIQQIPHENFERCGNHLIYKKKISMENAFLPESFQIVTLDDRILNVPVDSTISQTTATVIKNEGMAIINSNDPLEVLERRQKRGDLIVKYEVEFTKFFTDSQKQKIKSVIAE